MVESDYAKKISDDDVGGSGVNNDDEEDDEENENENEIVRKNNQTGYWCGIGGRGKKDFGRAKRVILYPFFEAKKKLSCKNKKPFINSTKTISSDESVNQGCGFCLSKLKVSGSKNETQTTDPNDKNFTYDMLKLLIENNDFYSKESNPHLVKPCKVGPGNFGCLLSVLESGAVGGNQQPRPESSDNCSLPASQTGSF